MQTAQFDLEDLLNNAIGDNLGSPANFAGQPAARVNNEMLMLQGFLVGSDGGLLYLFERDGEGAARTYRKSKTLAIEGQSVKIRNLAASPAEDTLLCTLENNQMYSLNLTNTEVMKVQLQSAAHDLIARTCHLLVPRHAAVTNICLAACKFACLFPKSCCAVQSQGV